MKEIFPVNKKRTVAYYRVINVIGEIVFQSPTYAICNSYIINHQLAGVRPKPVYEED